MGITQHERPNRGFTDDWWTPLEVIHALGRFDLDPCGNNRHETAMLIYENEGLEREWFGRVWLNPPYSDVGKWLDKLAVHGEGVALVFARTETKWAQRHLKIASQVFFLSGRLKFLKSGVDMGSNAGAPNMFLNYGVKSDFSKLKGILWNKP